MRIVFLLLLVLHPLLTKAQKRYEYSRFEIGLPIRVGKIFPLVGDFKVKTKVSFEWGLQVHYRISQKSGLVANVNYGYSLIDTNAMAQRLNLRYKKENYINTSSFLDHDWDNLQMMLAYSHKLSNKNLKLLAGISMLRLYTAPNFIYEVSHSQNINDVLTNRILPRSHYRKFLFGPVVGAQVTKQVLKGILLIAQPELSYHFTKYYVVEVGANGYREIPMGLSGLNMGIRLGFMCTPYNGIHPYEDEK